MKAFKNSIYLGLMVLALALTACSSDDSGDNNDGDDNSNSGGEQLMTAKVDGADFAASQDPADLIGATKSSQGGVSILTVQGSTNSGDFINFTVFDYNGTGTYSTGDSPANTSLIQYGELVGTTGADVWASNLASSQVGGLAPGEITVTVDDDSVVEGTFSFEGYNPADMTTKTITEGRFKANLDN